MTARALEIAHSAYQGTHVALDTLRSKSLSYSTSLPMLFVENEDDTSIGEILNFDHLLTRFTRDRYVWKFLVVNLKQLLDEEEITPTFYELIEELYVFFVRSLEDFRSSARSLKPFLDMMDDTIKSVSDYRRQYMIYNSEQTFFIFIQFKTWTQWLFQKI